ncbi:hypothetical protein AK830_g8273 [Neonectria ditissima]|uniref:Uncharacterized protein n=1 Tax=Neonectria ditissima TaxID=78410 RepID=A0A0P7BEL4_9HYPO|nr:hypothetical protein AK830_g8273 [Neonectria ditissima]
MKTRRHELFPGGDAAVTISLRRPNQQTLFGLVAAHRLGLLAGGMRELGEKSITRNEAGTKEASMPLDDPDTGSKHSSTNTHVEEPPAIQIQVSSQNLMLASPVFRKMLKGPWKEGIASTSSGLISTSEWDEKAFVMMLDIIHGHHWDIPKSISLEILTKFAVIVDYYQCHEVVDIFVEKWLREMEKDLPTHFGLTSVMWLCISWVFSRSGTFNALVTLSLRHQKGPIGFVYLPIAPLLGQ